MMVSISSKELEGQVEVNMILKIYGYIKTRQSGIDLCNPMFLRPMGKGQARTRRWVIQSNIKKIIQNSRW